MDRIPYIQEREMDRKVGYILARLAATREGGWDLHVEIVHAEFAVRPHVHTLATLLAETPACTVSERQLLPTCVYLSL
jgi:hypothetical protein